MKMHVPRRIRQFALFESGNFDVVKRDTVLQHPRILDAKKSKMWWSLLAVMIWYGDDGGKARIECS